MMQITLGEVLEAALGLVLATIQAAAVVGAAAALVVLVVRILVRAGVL